MEASYCEDDPFYGLFLEEGLSFFDMEGGRIGLSGVLAERERQNRISHRILASAKNNEFTANRDEEFDDQEFEDVEIRDIDPNTY